MGEPAVKPSEEYVDGFIKLTAKARVWYKSAHGYRLVIGGREFAERFKVLGGDRKHVLIEVDTQVARFIYRTYSYVDKGYVKFHCPRDFNETWKALHAIGDFVVSVYIPYVNHSAKGTGGDGNGGE